MTSESNTTDRLENKLEEQIGELEEQLKEVKKKAEISRTEWKRYREGGRIYPPVFMDEEIGLLDITTPCKHKFKVKDYAGYPFIEIRECFQPAPGNLRELENRRVHFYAKNITDYIRLLKKAERAINKATIDAEKEAENDKKKGMAAYD